MRAILLAGGAGTRLRQVVSDVPKPLAPVCGRPFLSYLLDLLKLRGFTEIILSVGYMRDAIMEEYGTSYSGLRIDYAIEETPLGTGGGLRNALDQVRDFPIFACNADTFLDLDYQGMLREHMAAGAGLSVAVRHIDNAGRYGKARVEAGRIIAFDSAGEDGPGWINAGVYLFGENLLASESATAAFSFERDFLERHISALHPTAFRTEAYFIDIGVPEDYMRAQTELPERVTALRRHSPR
jgi:D-glycero-alpha-D-manno-heptose 1-phosphate guanylyltransferase